MVARRHWLASSLIFSQDGSEQGKVIALNAIRANCSGKHLAMRKPPRSFSFCTPLVIERSGQSQVILPGSNVVQALDAATGKEICGCVTKAIRDYPRPIVAAGLIMICTGYDRPSLIAIKPDGQATLRFSHRLANEDSVPHTPSLCTRDGLLFMVSDSGIAICLDAKP